jgi:hypothetical protein
LPPLHYQRQRRRHYATPPMMPLSAECRHIDYAFFSRMLRECAAMRAAARDAMRAAHARCDMRRRAKCARGARERYGTRHMPDARARMSRRR